MMKRILVGPGGTQQVAARFCSATMRLPQQSAILPMLLSTKMSTSAFPKCSSSYYGKSNTCAISISARISTIARRTFFTFGGDAGGDKEKSTITTDTNKYLQEQHDEIKNNIWALVRAQAEQIRIKEPLLTPLLDECILQHKSFRDALIHRLATKLESSVIPSKIWTEMLQEGYKLSLSMGLHFDIEKLAMEDLIAIEERDPACKTIVQAFLYFKGYKAAQLYRFSHAFWLNNREDLALVVQGRCSELFGVDIHPNAQIGPGFLIDHATGVVVGETAVIGRNCSFLHGVTLGGTGAPVYDRHPKLGDNVFVGCSSCILGNIRIGDHCKIGSGSIVVKALPNGATAVGNPAKIMSIDSRYYTENSTEHMHLLHPKKSFSDDVKDRPEHKDSEIKIIQPELINSPNTIVTWNHAWFPKVWINYK